MIDKEELKTLVNQTQIILLERIKKLSEAAGLLDDIKLEVDGPFNDEYLMAFVKYQLEYRYSLAKLDEEWDKLERSFWDRMIHINELKKEEEIKS